MTLCSPKMPEKITLDIVRSAADAYGVDCLGFIGTRNEVPFGESEVAMVEECCKWLVKNTIVAKTGSSSTTSYYLKHLVERASGTYITNGAMIVAGILLGFRIKRVNELNAHFNMRMQRGLRL